MASMQFPTLTDEEKNKALAESLMAPMAPTTPAPIPAVTPEAALSVMPVAGTTTTMSKVMPQLGVDALADMGAANNQIAAAQGNILMAEADQAKAELELRKQADAAMAKAQAEDQKRLAANQKLVDANRADIDLKVQEYAQLKPVDFWAKKGTADKVTMGLAIILGGLAQGFGAKDNAALKIMGDAINQDMQSQQLLMQQKLQAIDNSRKSLEDKRAERSAILAAGQARNEAALQQVKRQAEMLGLQTTSAVAKDKLAVLTGGLQQKLAEQQAEYAKNFMTTITREEKVLTPGEVKAAQYKALPESDKKVIEGLGTINSSALSVKTELEAALQQLKDPNLSENEKLSIAMKLPKAIQSIRGSDAITGEDFPRAAGELTTSGGKILGSAVAGAGTGAGAAAYLGAPAPLIAGAGALGAIGAGGAAFLDELGKPGGPKLFPDVKAFTKSVESTSKRIEAMIERNDILGKLVEQGVSVPNAAKMADQQVAKKYGAPVPDINVLNRAVSK